MGNETCKLEEISFEDSYHETIFSLYDSVDFRHVDVCPLHHGGWLFCRQLCRRAGLQRRQYFAAGHHQLLRLGDALEYRRAE